MRGNCDNNSKMRSQIASFVQAILQNRKIVILLLHMRKKLNESSAQNDQLHT